MNMKAVQKEQQRNPHPRSKWGVSCNKWGRTLFVSFQKKETKSVRPHLLHDTLQPLDDQVFYVILVEGVVSMARAFDQIVL